MVVVYEWLVVSEEQTAFCEHKWLNVEDCKR